MDIILKKVSYQEMLDKAKKIILTQDKQIVSGDFQVPAIVKLDGVTFTVNFSFFSFQMNFGLAIFNLLPIYPFDGYNIEDFIIKDTENKQIIKFRNKTRKENQK